MNSSFKKLLLNQHNDCGACPTNDEIVGFFQHIVALLYPHFSAKTIRTEEDLDKYISSLTEQTKRLFTNYPKLCPFAAEDMTTEFMDYIPTLHQSLNLDIDAIFAEDPAAKSKNEIVRCYPGFYAIAAYRIAHRLHELGVKVIPRIITEHAHSHTGIDIHPAAEIGDYFCIDHGTGVVIGETTVIGNGVKLYQGVTLGALSVQKADANVKRHPTIEDDVVIYSNATILGGDTVIGKGSMIGGNVWITRSVPTQSKVYYISGDNQIEKIEQSIQG